MSFHTQIKQAPTTNLLLYRQASLLYFVPTVLNELKNQHTMKTIIPIILFLLPLFLSGQEVIATGGDVHQGSTHSISYTIGETVIETEVSAEYQATQGFQQGWIDIVDDLDEINLEEITINLYPNPVGHILHISMSEIASGQRIELYDIKGKLLQEVRIEDTLTEMDMEQYSNGTYLLRLFSDKDRSMKSFTLIVSK